MISKYQPIKASVSQSLLGRADRLFKGGISTVLTELVQNSRRAGATEINVTATQVAEYVRIIFADDGGGCVDPLSLITLAESGWEAGVEASEDPGGCGFYSLLGLGTDTPVAVASRDWRMTLTRSIMLGKDEVIPVEGQEIRGMVIDFFAKCKMEHLKTLVFAQTQFSGLRAVFNSQPQEPADFLKGCQHVVEYSGVRIGISETCQIPDDRYRTSITGDRYHRRSVNFYGCRPCPPRDGWTELTGWGDESKSVFIRLDIRDARCASMTLPQRDSVRDTPLFNDIIRRARTEAVGYALKRWHGRHKMNFATRNKLEAETGLKIPDAIPELLSWQFHQHTSSEGEWPDISRAERITVKSERAFRLVRVTNRQDLRALHIMLAITGADETPSSAMPGIFLVEDVYGYKGYPWYDSITDIEDLKVEISETPRKGAKREWWELNEYNSDVIASEDRNISEMQLRITCPAWGKPEHLPLPLLIRVTEDTNSWCDELVAPMVSKSWFCKSKGDDAAVARLHYVERMLNMVAWKGGSEFGDSESDSEEAGENVRLCVSHALFGPQALLELLVRKMIAGSNWEINRAALEAGISSINIRIPIPKNAGLTAAAAVKYQPLKEPDKKTTRKR